MKFKTTKETLLNTMKEFIDAGNAVCALPAGELKVSYTSQVTTAMADTGLLREKLKTLN